MRMISIERPGFALALLSIDRNVPKPLRVAARKRSWRAERERSGVLLPFKDLSARGPLGVDLVLEDGCHGVQASPLG